MTTKELKIEVPLGYEVDVENSNLSDGIVRFKSIVQVDQQEFDTFFKGLLEGYESGIFIDKYGKETAIPTDHFVLYNENGEWLFEIRKGDNGYFGYSESRIYLLFQEKFGVNYLQLRDLMQPVLNNVFNLYGVTPEQLPTSPYR